MNKNNIRFISFTREKEKWCMWSGKLMARYVIKGYHVLITGAKKILADDADKTEDKEFSALNLLNFTSYNELILSQEDRE